MVNGSESPYNTAFSPGSGSDPTGSSSVKS